MKFIYLLLGLSLLVACYSESEADLFSTPMTHNNTGTDTTSMDTTVMATVSFATQIAPIIQTKCTNPGCHVPGGPGNVFLRNYNEIKSIASTGQLNNRVVVQMSMPPQGSLPSAQIQLIKDWLNEGALNN